MDRKIEKQLLDKANVMSVGYGRKIINGEMTDKPCIMVGVTKKIEASALTKQDLVPNKVNEMETDVFEVGFIKAQQEVDPKHKFRPAMPGVSIGHKNITAGTFGCVVQRNGEKLILSNNHVLANSNDARIGDAIYQPGAYDGGTFLDKIGTLFDFIPLVYEGNNNDGGGTGGGGGTCSFAKKTASIANFAAKTLGRKHRLMAYNPEAEVNLIDAALAKPDNPSDILDEIINIGKPAGIAEINVGDKVQKYGRTTGYTTGTVISVGATTNVSYGTNKMATFRNQIMTGDMSDGGDSGSAVLDMNKNIVGLLFAGSDQVTIFCPIQTVFELLNISL